MGQKQIIVTLNSITRSFCLRHYVQNSLSYPAEETQPTLCLKGCQAKLGLITLRTINEQFGPSLIYNKILDIHKMEVTLPTQIFFFDDFENFVRLEKHVLRSKLNG
jgi:hypothetical protein